MLWNIDRAPYHNEEFFRGYKDDMKYPMSISRKICLCLEGVKIFVQSAVTECGFSAYEY
jgi:hypothetical protein